MKKITLALAALLLFAACEKESSLDFSEGLSVHVKLIDYICDDFIYQIQDAEYVALGQSNFEYKGKTYDGVFSSAMLCGGITGQQLLPINAEDSIYSVKLYREQPNLTSKCPNCCLAVLDRKPSIFYYVIPD